MREAGAPGAGSALPAAGAPPNRLRKRWPSGPVWPSWSSTAPRMMAPLSTSCVLLSAAYRFPHALWIPALVLSVLAFVYSLVDEAFHWRRYVRKHSDRVEMWSHLGIMSGHTMMMLGWWSWFAAGYPGVAATLAAW